MGCGRGGAFRGRGLGGRGGAARWAGSPAANGHAQLRPRPASRGGCCIVMSAGRAASAEAARGGCFRPDKAALSRRAGRTLAALPPRPRRRSHPARPARREQPPRPRPAAAPERPGPRAPASAARPGRPAAPRGPGRRRQVSGRRRTRPRTWAPRTCRFPAPAPLRPRTPRARLLFLGEGTPRPARTPPPAPAGTPARTLDPPSLRAAPAPPRPRPSSLPDIRGPAPGRAPSRDPAPRRTLPSASHPAFSGSSPPREAGCPPRGRDLALPSRPDASNFGELRLCREPPPRPRRCRTPRAAAPVLGVSRAPCRQHPVPGAEPALQAGASAPCTSPFRALVRIPAPVPLSQPPTSRSLTRSSAGGGSALGSQGAPPATAFPGNTCRNVSRRGGQGGVGRGAGAPRGAFFLRCLS